ncbi:MAG: tetratricopeptide repeat protein [Cyanobacteria bacterium SZAS-4]|nr:tetratricopeptide repeat protein [Cyanobacteria bacterium SZAS-4]
MIDQSEAERLVLRQVNGNCAPGEEKFEITRCDEKRYGWVMHYDGKGEGRGQYDGNVPIVVERENGKLTTLYGSAWPLSTTLGWFESEWLWRSEFNSALELAKRGEFPEAQAKLLACFNGVDEMIGDRPHNQGGRLTIEFALNCLISLGELHLKAGNLDAADGTLMEAKQRLDKWAPLNQVAMLEHRVPILQNLISLRGKQKRAREADQFKREIATAYRTARESLKSQEVLEQQLEKRVDLYPQGHPAVAQTLTDLAILKSDLNQYFEAQLFLEAAMQIWEPILQDPALLRKHADATTTFPMQVLLQCAADTMDSYASYVLMRQGRREESTALRDRAKLLMAQNGAQIS